MERWYHIYFKDKTEYVDGPEIAIELPIAHMEQVAFTPLSKGTRIFGVQ